MEAIGGVLLEGSPMRERYWEEMSADEKVDKLLVIVEHMSKIKVESGRTVEERLNRLENHRHDESGQVVVSVTNWSNLDRELFGDDGEIARHNRRSLVSKAPKGWSKEIAQAKDANGVPLPMFESHKVVGAAKIALVEIAANPRDGAALSCNGGLIIAVSEEYITRNDPQVGGYYVRYKDGYESYSPAEAFEQSCTRIW